MSLNLVGFDMVTHEPFPVFDARLKAPFSMLVAGPSRSGKSTFCLRLLENMDTLIDKPVANIVWFYGQETSVLVHLKSIYGSRFVAVKGIPQSFDTYIDHNLHQIFVFDDLMKDCAKSSKITDLVTKQCHHQNVSAVMITQNLFCDGKERKNIMRSVHYLVIFNNPLDYSLVHALGQKIMPRNLKTFLNIYEIACSRPHGYLFIDGSQMTPQQARFRTDIFGKHQRVFIPREWEKL